MAKKVAAKESAAAPRQKTSALVDTRVIYCGDNLEQLQKLPDACVDLIYIDPPFNSNRNYEIFWPETSEKRRFDDRHESTTAYIEYMRPRCEQLARVLKKTGSFYYHCDWHAIRTLGLKYLHQELLNLIQAILSQISRSLHPLC